ncbi:MAG: O-antigen ligase family protein [Planctomycetales bacterium]|nr:O-antigen ligase family protein [Planctomycetales bacterium]
MSRLRAFRITHCLISLVCAAVLFWRSTVPSADAGTVGWAYLGYQPSWIAVGFAAVSIALAALSAWNMTMGAIAVSMMAFGIPRYSAELQFAWDNGFQLVIISLSLMGSLHSRPFRRHLLQAWQRRDTWLRLLLAVTVWATVCEAVALFFGRELAGPKHHLLRTIESAMTLVVVFAFLSNRRSYLVLVASAIASIAFVTAQLDEIERASDYAFSIAPFACLLAGTATSLSWPGMLVFFSAATCCSFLSIGTASRAANVGLLCGLCSLILAKLRSVRSIAVVSALLAASLFFALASPLRPRIDQWMEAGWDTPTLASRMQFWRATVSHIPQNGIFGVGPGRGGKQMSSELELSKWKATHSSPFEILEEQGIVGCLLWCVLLAIGLRSARRGSRSENKFVSAIAIAIGCSLITVAVNSLAISRHDDMRLYWLLGLSFAVETLSHRENDNVALETSLNQ